MKKILLSFVGVACVLLSHAQLIINELYVRPNPNPNPPKQEYFELRNTSNIPENAGCYSLVTYFKDGAQVGFYVVDLPGITVAPHGFLVGSSKEPDFNYQNGTGHADFSWNSGNIKRYVYSNGALRLDMTGAPYDNIFVGSNGGNGNGGNKLYSAFLFKGNSVADIFLGSNNSNVVPDFITGLGVLNHTSTDACGNINYNFGGINAEPADLFGHVIPEAGTNNGYFRYGMGCGNNGVWKKAAAPADHTPGVANGGDQGAPSASELLQADAVCLSNTTISYNITAGASQAFPVKVSVYYDANGSQFLDDGDILIGTQTDASVNDPAKTFTHADGQEDFIFVLDGKGDCYDASFALNCPAAITLPVTFTSFTATKSGSGVSLKWTTASESNNRGFNVQRLQGNGSWQTLGFVSSQAAGGNSSSVLTYTYTDANLGRGTIQYRLQQIDMDGKTKYSDIRTIRNDAAVGKTAIYPNPSNGAANITFGENGSHDVLISDINGRVVKQYRAITDDNIRVDNLMPGVYMIRIVEQRSGSQSNERLVVSGR